MDALADFADRHPGNDATGLSPNECIDGGGGESRDREEAEEGQSKEARKGGGSQIFRRIKTSRPTRTPLTEHGRRMSRGHRACVRDVPPSLRPLDGSIHDH